MFYLPEMFTNYNKEKFGHKQDGHIVDIVVLPRWAQNPQDFVRKHLAALETNHVSQNINH